MKVLVKLSCQHWQYVEVTFAKFGNKVKCVDCGTLRTIVYVPNE